MNSRIKSVLSSSIFRKQVIALTGLAMIGFVIAHLSGNLLIFLGPAAFNGYAERLTHILPLLWVMRVGLMVALVLHVWLTILLVRKNGAARPRRYEVDDPKGDRRFAARMMLYTGLVVPLFLILHLYDFTFGNKSGPQSVIGVIDPGQSLGLFGLVWNSFKLTDPINGFRVVIYVLAVICVGLHLAHALQSVAHTFGLTHRRYSVIVDRASVAIGAIVAAGFASIPIYVLLSPRPWGI